MNLTTQRGYWFRFFMSLSIALCALFGGKPYETACAAAWRLQNSDSFIKRTWARSTIRLMNLFEKNHCRTSNRIHQRIMFGLKYSKSEQHRMIVQKEG